MPVPTPHINAKLGDFAETVLMPGDPLRSKFIAETFLTDPVLVNNVRGVQGYTGLYKGKRVSVMASGMGMPSMGIYSYELFNFYDVKNIIRIGSAGAVSPDLPLRSIVIGMSASFVSSFQSQYNLPGIYAARAGKNALCICTISDSLVTGEATTAEERQNSFTQMMELALETA